MKRNSRLIGSKRFPTVVNTIGVYVTFDQYNARRNNTWAATPTFDRISFPSGTSFNEGTYFYSTNPISAGLTTADFTDNSFTGTCAGSVTITKL